MGTKENYLLKCILFLLILCTPSPASRDQIDDTAISAAQIEKGIEDAVTNKIRELKWLGEEANRLGIKLSLVGNNALDLAAYVRWSQLRQLYPNDFPEHRFDYHWTNVFPHSVPIELFAEGDDAKIKILEELIKTQEPHLVENGVNWSLKPKSNETLLSVPFSIQLSHPKSESRIQSALLILEQIGKREIPLGKHSISYPSNAEESFAAILKFLDTNFRWDYHLSTGDVNQLKSKLAEIKIEEILQNPEARKRLSPLVQGLTTRAQDLSYAFQILDSLEIRNLVFKAYQKGHYNPAEIWGRIPMRSFPLGTRSSPSGENGSTENARRLDHYRLLSHSTPSLDAFDSLTGTITGKANLLLGRTNWGYGFYTVPGDEKWNNSSFLVQLELIPGSYLNIDYVDTYQEDLGRQMVVVPNPAALRVVPPSFLQRRTEDLLEMLLLRLKNSGSENRGEVTLLERRLATETNFLNKWLKSEQGERRILAWKKKGLLDDPRVFTNMSLDRPILRGIANFLENRSFSDEEDILRFIRGLHSPSSNAQTRLGIRLLMEDLRNQLSPEAIKNKWPKETIEKFLWFSMSEKRHHRGLALEPTGVEEFPNLWFQSQISREYPEFIDELAKETIIHDAHWLAKDILEGTHWMGSPILMEKLLFYPRLALDIFREEIANYHNLLEPGMSTNNPIVKAKLFQKVKDAWKMHPAESEEIKQRFLRDLSSGRDSFGEFVKPLVHELLCSETESVKDAKVWLSYRNLGRLALEEEFDRFASGKSDGSFLRRFYGDAENGEGSSLIKPLLNFATQNPDKSLEVLAMSNWKLKGEDAENFNSLVTTSRLALENSTKKVEPQQTSCRFTFKKLWSSIRSALQ